MDGGELPTNVLQQSLRPSPPLDSLCPPLSHPSDLHVVQGVALSSTALACGHLLSRTTRHAMCVVWSVDSSVSLRGILIQPRNSPDTILRKCHSSIWQRNGPGIKSISVIAKGVLYKIKFSGLLFYRNEARTHRDYRICTSKFL